MSLTTPDVRHRPNSLRAVSNSTVSALTVEEIGRILGVVTPRPAGLAEPGLIVLAEPAEPQRAPDLGPVVLERAPGPLVASQLDRVDPDLAGDVTDRSRRQFPDVAGEPAFHLEVLQQQHARASSDRACRRPARARPARPTSTRRPGPPAPTPGAGPSSQRARRPGRGQISAARVSLHVPSTAM